MDIEYPVKLRVCLEPTGRPWVRIAVAGQQRQCQLSGPVEFDFEFTAAHCAELVIEHYNKSDLDPSTEVNIRSIEFFGIKDPKFVWTGVYNPQYPEPWFSQQTAKPSSTLTGVSCLGWNGTYSLKFDVPVFTWIHQVQNLGWIYR